jgi:hypothetical protein
MTAILTITGLCLAIAVSAVTLYRLVLTDRKVQEVHVLVNSQLSAVVARVTQLTDTLKHAEVDVPPPPGES